MKFDLVVIGHIMKEIIKFPDREIGPVLGSPAAYSSVAAGVLGARTGIVTVIGKDMPDFLINPIVEANVDTKGIKLKDCCTRTTILTYDCVGNKKVSYLRIPPNIIFDDIPKCYLNAPAFFICPMDFEVPIETINEFKKNRIIMTDLGGYGGTVSTFHPDKDNLASEDIVKDIVSRFNIVKASVEDCIYLFPSLNNEKDYLYKLLDMGPEVVIITLGKSGSIISDHNKVFEIPAFKTDVKDTTGAGDVFCAAFLLEWLRTENLYKSGIYASAASSIVVEKSGGVIVNRMPTDKGVRERIRSLSN